MSSSSKEKTQTEQQAITQWLEEMQKDCRKRTLEHSVSPDATASIVKLCQHINGMTPQQERAKACLMTFGYTPGIFKESTFRAASQICGLGNVISNGLGGTMGTDNLMQCVAHGGSSAPPMCAPLTSIVETARQHINLLESHHIGPAPAPFMDDDKRLKESLVEAVQKQKTDEVMEICKHSFRNQPKAVMHKIVDLALTDPDHRLNMTKISEFVDLPEMCNEFRSHVSLEYLEQEHNEAVGAPSHVSLYGDLFREIVDSCSNIDHSTVTPGDVGRALGAKTTESTSVCQLIKTHATQMGFRTDDISIQRELADAMNFTVSFNGGV